MSNNTYIDPFIYQQMPTGNNVSGYIGNLFRFTSSQIIGGSLSVPASAITTTMQAYDSLYIFDGPHSEVVQPSAEVTIGSTNISLVSSTLYTHAAGTPVCSDGPLGSLGLQILIASQWLEDEITRQPLWQTAYTNEILTLPTMRASFDNQMGIHFRPRHFPVTAISAISLQNNTMYTVGYDPTQAVIDSDQQTVDLPVLAVITTSGSGTSSQAYPYWLTSPGIGRNMTSWMTINYTAGFLGNNLPWPVRRACSLLVNETFVQLQNPIGADDTSMGKRHVTFTLRGEVTGKSLLVKQAEKLLQPYSQQSF